jgi:hypothetical protein
MASSTEFMQLLQKKDPKALKILFEDYHNKLVAISIRYSKNDSQAQQLFHFAFAQCYNLLQQERNNKSLDLGAFLNEKFIEGCIQFIKSIRNEYYVSSTVYAIEGTSTSNNLFDNDQWVDLRIVRTWTKPPKDGKDQLGILEGDWPDTALANTWDEYIENILPIGISNLFLFDGEQVKELAELDKKKMLDYSKKVAEQAAEYNQKLIKD